MGRWWRRRSLRARVTLASTAGLAVALFAVALLLRAELRASLSDGLDNTARQGAQEVAALADAHRLPDPVPVAAGTITVQVLNTGGRPARPAAARGRGGGQRPRGASGGAGRPALRPAQPGARGDRGHPRR